MKNPNDVCPEAFDEVFHLLEDVYGSAYWALRHGATKEDILDQIDQAVEMHQETEVEHGRFVGLDTEARDGEAPA